MPLLKDTIRWRDMSGGVVTNVSSDIVVQNSVPFAMNLLFDKELGLGVSRLGTAIIGSQLSAGNVCRGLFQHIDSTPASSKLFAGFNGSIYDVIAGGAGMANGTGLTAGNDMHFATFLNTTLMLNGAEKRSYTAAGGWITTAGVLDIGNIPANAKFPIEYKDRMYCVVTDRLYYSTTPVAGAISWTNAGSGSIQVEQEDGGGTIQGLAKVPGYLLIFKQHSLKRWNFDSSFPEDLVNIGTQSARSIVYGKGICFFFYGPKGFYATKGGYPEKISKPIQRIVDAISSSFYTSINGWCDNEHVYWSVGDITVDFGTGYTETHNNVVLRFSVDTQEWAVLKYAHEFRAMTKYVSSNNILTIAGNTDGHVLQLNSGTSDYGTVPIVYIAQSPELDFGRRERLKTITDKIIVHALNASAAILQVRMNYGQWRNVGTVKGLVTEVQVKESLRANVFEFRLTNSTTGLACKLRGLDFPSVDIHESVA